MNNTGTLSTLRGKITATILILLALNAAGLIWIAFNARAAISPLTWGVTGTILLVTLGIAAGALKILHREAQRGIADINAVFRNIQGQEADLSCTMKDLDNPDLKHISVCYNGFLASVRELTSFSKIAPGSRAPPF